MLGVNREPTPRTVSEAKIGILMEAVTTTWPDDPEDEHEEEPEPKHEEEEEPLRCMSNSGTGRKQFENFNPP